MMVEIVPGITRDSERAFARACGTRVTAAQVLRLLASRRSEADISAEHRPTSEQIRAVLRYAAMLADQNLDAAIHDAIDSDGLRFYRVPRSSSL